MKKNIILKQIKNNTVALVSIFIAVTSLSYNTWRNEKTEDNRNQRYAAFETLLKINELQQLVFHNYYDKDTEIKGNPRTGWTYVLTINDFSRLLHEPLPSSCSQLQQIWDDNWKDISTNQASVDAILAGIDQVRSDVLLLLKNLE